MSPATSDGPRLWIVAGPNGSGKTSIYDNADIEDFGRSVWIINPDALAKRVLAAKERRFTVRLIYVVLNSPELNIERVRLRVAKGGHNVPMDKIIERRGRSLAQLPWFLAQADDAWLFDNSGEKPQSIGMKSKGEIKLEANALPEIVEAASLARRKSDGGEVDLA